MWSKVGKTLDDSGCSVRYRMQQQSDTVRSLRAHCNDTRQQVL